jgi:hypothetical protein
MPGCEAQGGRESGQMKDYNPPAISLVQAVRIVCEVHTADSNSPQGFTVCFGRPPAFVTVREDPYWEAWRVLRKYAASDKKRPSAKAVELFQRGLEFRPLKPPRCGSRKAEGTNISPSTSP